MRFSQANAISLCAVLGVMVPPGAMAADAPALGSIVVSPATGPALLHVTGTVPGARQLQAVVYVTYAPDLPTVMLSRRPLATDGAGHFDAILSMAPATLPGALITVVVQTAAAVPVARGSITIVDPNVFLPAHDAP